MTLRMVRSKHSSFVAELLCDQCHQPITDIELAMVIWIDPAGWEAGKPGDTAEARIIHKGRCDTHKGDVDTHSPWLELSAVLERLSELRVPAREKAGMTA